VDGSCLCEGGGGAWFYSITEAVNRTVDVENDSLSVNKSWLEYFIVII
jgi:hypothetical protein